MINENSSNAYLVFVPYDELKRLEKNEEILKQLNENIKKLRENLETTDHRQCLEEFLGTLSRVTSYF